MGTRFIIYVTTALLSLGGCTFDRSGLHAGDFGSDVPQAGNDAAADVGVEATGGVDGPDGSPELSADAVEDVTTTPDITPPDATPFDTMTPDIWSGPIVIQAESFDTQKLLDGTHNWEVRTSIGGYSGSAYIRAKPTSPSENCNSNITTCGAQADYSFTLPASGTYYFHFRVRYSDQESNSLRWGVDGSDKGSMSSQTYSQWMFLTDSTSLAPGAHTLNIWMRENGARLDLVGITAANQPPPVP